MFASKKYLDLHLEKFWTIAGSGWCLSNRLNIDGSHHFEAHEICPWYSSNEVTTMAPPLKWPDSQHKRMQKKPVPSPLARLSLSQVTALAFAKLSSGRLESFSPVQQRYAKVTQGKNQEPLRIHDSWCKFPSPNRKYIHHSWYCCMSSVCTFLLFLPLQDGPENSVSKVPLVAAFRKMQLALNG